MREAHRKLDHLAGSNPLLPWAVDAQQSHGVVAIHNDVDEAVDRGTEVAIAASLYLADQEPGPDQQHVMVAVQEGDLIVLLS